MVNYRLFVPKQAVGANLVYFDLWNNSDYTVEINYVKPVVSGAVAVTGLLGVDLFLTYTSAIGTGGTAATFDGTDPTAMTFSRYNPQATFLTNSGISARLTPTGGATAGAVISWTCVFTEETNSGTYTTPMSDFVRYGDIILLPKSSGIRVVQGAVASVGNIGFNVGFNLIK